MAIEFDGSTTQNIQFATPATSSLGLILSTIMFSIDRASPSTYSLIYQVEPIGSSDEQIIILLDYASGFANAKITYSAKWSVGGNIEWKSNNAVLSIGENHIAITYDGTNSANNPIMYVNASSVAITKIGSNSGSYLNGTNCTMRIGSSVVNSPKAKIRNLFRFNHILSASEIADAYNTGLSGAYQWAEENNTGLVFCPNLNMATGITRSDFSGSTLSSSNLIIDKISCAQGVSSGGPIGR